jgi:3-keto-disaccharide hydrolase
MRSIWIAGSFFSLMVAAFAAAGGGGSDASPDQAGAAAADQGFTDTPMLPGLPYHVHDPARPHPRVVSPGAGPGQPPSDAEVLFDGKSLAKWTRATLGVPGNLGASGYSIQSGDAPWKVADGYFEVVPGSGAIATRGRFGSVQLHVEWASPSPPHGSSQDRGNSGIFIMGLYEVQVLDSYRNQTYADGQAGAIYGQWPPLVNATRPPGEWQAYDIVFEAPELEGDRVITPAYLTVFLNGVVLHNRKALIGPTVYRQAPKYTAGPPDGPIVLQDHDHPVRYRNIWIRPLTGYDRPETR